MTTQAGVVTTMAVLCLFTCTSKPANSPEAAVSTAFKAIAKKDWAAYRAITITTADYELKANKINPFQAKDSFAGGVMKPREIEQLRAGFEKAVSAEHADSISFTNARFKKLGTMIESGSFDTSGGKVGYEVYSVIMKQNGREVDSASMWPLFVVARWESQYRITGLRFPEKGP